MKRKLYLVLILTLIPALASALGLGRLDLKSALNEPFEARIELLSPTADELDSLNVGLADSNAFARANVDRPFILSALKFALRRSVDDSPDYIRVFSSEPIREPFLNFLVEVRWSNGRLYREYTVLLDPPLYDPNKRTTEFKQRAEISAPVAAIEDPDHKVVGSDAFEKYSGAPVARSTQPSSPQINYGGGDYGPVQESETLWSIASAMRPDSSVSVNQMMLALLRTNPDAFINNNINGLKRGQILRMPSESEINALNNAQALAEAQSQYAVWNDIKDSISSTVEERPELSAVPETTEPETDAVSETQEMVESDPELKLVAAEDTDEVTEQAASVDGGGGQDLILAQETIQALTQENLELKDQLQESEAILDDLKRLLSLKDDELAALQEQLAAAKMAEEAMEEVEEVIEEEPVEEAMEEVEEVIEEEPVEEAMEEVEEVMEEEPVEEAMEEEVEEVIEEIEIIETEPESAGIMGMVNQYLGQAKDIVMSVKDMVMGNLIVGLAIIGVLVVLIIIVVVMKFRKGSAEVMHIDAPTEEAFPDFDSGDIGDMGEGEDVADSESPTVLPGSEDETYLPGGESDADLEEEKTEFIGADETPAPEPEPTAAAEEEEEDDEDPLQEVNTYLAFEQFDQAEELVRNAINDDPDNAEYHSKLLEVFYTSGNKKAYEEAAKELHDKVGGEGEYWNMATAMWQEMSPNRALFEEGADEEEDDTSDTTGGFVDVTADDEAGETDGGGDLDFDIGGGEASDDALNVTGQEENENDEVLDITDASADSEEMFDVSGVGGEDLLDVTAATTADEASTDDEDMLDISSTGGEDLLDVTAAANIELDNEEDLLDVTAATGVGADSEDLLDIQADESVSEEPVESETIEFDVGGPDAETKDEGISMDLDMGESEVSDTGADDEMSLDMEIPSETEDEGISMDLDMGDAASDDSDANADDEISLDMDIPSETEDDSISLDLDMGDAASDDSDANADDEISLDMDIPSETEDDSISLDLGDATSDEADASVDEEVSLDMNMSTDDAADDGGIELDLSEVDDASAESEADLDFDIDMDSDAAAQNDDEISIDMDETVEIPKSSMDLSAADDDDEDDHTVFVPRSSEPEAQSEEDEVATKLDLAKAYVELGDTDSAKTILDEVMAEGNDEQKKQAEELLAQT